MENESGHRPVAYVRNPEIKQLLAQAEIKASIH